LTSDMANGPGGVGLWPPGDAAETAGGQAAFDVAVAIMLADARGWQSAEARERRGMPPEQVAGPDGR